MEAPVPQVEDVILEMMEASGYGTGALLDCLRSLRAETLGPSRIVVHTDGIRLSIDPEAGGAQAGPPQGPDMPVLIGDDLYAALRAVLPAFRRWDVDDGRGVTVMRLTANSALTSAGLHLVAHLLWTRRVLDPFYMERTTGGTVREADVERAMVSLASGDHLDLLDPGIREALVRECRGAVPIVIRAVDRAVLAQTGPWRDLHRVEDDERWTASPPSASPPPPAAAAWTRSSRRGRP